MQRLRGRKTKMPSARHLSAVALTLWLTVGSATAAYAIGRQPLGTFQGWGAFRDRSPDRCFAIADPVRRGQAGDWHPFVAVSSWPRLGVRGQVHIRLRARKLFGAPIGLAIGDGRFALVAGGADAWAPNAAIDARIVAAMRSGRSMSVETTGRDGRPLVDVYALRGAATAIDAASLGCVVR